MLATRKDSYIIKRYDEKIMEHETRSGYAKGLLYHSMRKDCYTIKRYNEEVMEHESRAGYVEELLYYRDEEQ